MTQTKPYSTAYKICPKCECLLKEKDVNSQESTPKSTRNNRSSKLYVKGSTPCKCCVRSSSSSVNSFETVKKPVTAPNNSTLPVKPLVYPPNALPWPPPNKPPDEKTMRFPFCCKKKKPIVKLDSGVQTSFIQVDDNKTQVSKTNVKTADKTNCGDPQFCQNARCPLSCCPDKKCYNNSFILPPNEPAVRSSKLNDDAIEALQSFIKAESRTNRRVMEDILAELDRQRRDIRELKEMFDVMVRLFKQNLFEGSVNYGEKLKKTNEEENNGRRRQHANGGDEKITGRMGAEQRPILEDVGSRSSLDRRSHTVPVTDSFNNKIEPVNKKPEIPPLKVNPKGNTEGSNRNKQKRLMGICGLCKRDNII